MDDIGVDGRNRVDLAEVHKSDGISNSLDGGCCIFDLPHQYRVLYRAYAYLEEAARAISKREFRKICEIKCGLIGQGG